MATKIMFLATTVYQTIPPVTYNAGDIVELRDDIAMRWLSRGLATSDAEAIAKAEAPAPSPNGRPPEVSASIPDDWRGLNAADTVALAASLGAAEVKTKASAIDFIEAEIARRADGAQQG